MENHGELTKRNYKPEVHQSILHQWRNLPKFVECDIGKLTQKNVWKKLKQYQLLTVCWHYRVHSVTFLERCNRHSAASETGEKVLLRKNLHLK